MRAFTIGVIAISAAIALLGLNATRSAESSSDLRQLAAACATCHGPNGEGNEARSAPRLAGIEAQYLALQLSNFINGNRGDHWGDMFGSQMSVVSRSLKEEDIAVISKYYAGLKEPSFRSTFSGDLVKGKAIYSTCAACHGEKGEGNGDIGAPRLAGQSDWYVARSLMAFKDGARGYASDDIVGNQMVQAAQVLETQKDANDVAAYIGSIKSH